MKKIILIVPVLTFIVTHGYGINFTIPSTPCHSDVAINYALEYKFTIIGSPLLFGPKKIGINLLDVSILIRQSSNLAIKEFDAFVPNYVIGLLSTTSGFIIISWPFLTLDGSGEINLLNILVGVPLFIGGLFFINESTNHLKKSFNYYNAWLTKNYQCQG